MLQFGPFAVVAICAETAGMGAGVRSLLRTPPVTCRLPQSVKTSSSVLAGKKGFASNTMAPTVCCWPSPNVILGSQRYQDSSLDGLCAITSTSAFRLSA